MPDLNKIPEPAVGLRRIWRAFYYSLEGLKHGFIFEPAFRQEVFLLVVLIPAALLIPVSSILKLILIVSSFGVLITELLNSAIECLADRDCHDFDPFVKKAKDMGSAAVLLSLLNLAVCWIYALYRIFS